MNRTPPNPRQVKEKLFRIQTMAAKLGIEYQEAYDAGYLGVRDAQDEKVTTSSGYSDPTGNIATATQTTKIRDTNAQVAIYIDQVERHMHDAYNSLTGSIRLINRYLTDDKSDGYTQLSELPEGAEKPPHEQ